MEMLKAEGASRASMQTSYSRTKVGYGDSKTALAERQSRTLFVSHPSKYAEVIYDEEEDESPEVKEASSGTESNYYVLVHKDMPSTTLPEPEKSDNQDSLPETSSQDKEAGASFANAEERSKADELENFQITTDQPYSDIGSFEEYEGESEEKVQVDDDTKASPEVQLPKLTRKQARRKRRRAFFITVKSPDNLTMLSRTPSEIENLEATRYEYIYNESKEPQKNIMPAQEDSKAEVKIKKQKHKTTKVSSQGGVVDEDQERTSKVKLSDKKQETSKQKKHSTPGAIEDINQESATKVEKQSKKVKIPKKERPSSYDRMPHKALEPGREDLVSKAEVQVKKLKPGGEEHAISSEIQEKGIPLENLKPEEKLLLKGSQSQVEILDLLIYMEVLICMELLRYVELLICMKLLIYTELLIYVELLRYVEVLIYVELLIYTELLIYVELLRYVEVLLYVELLIYMELLIYTELLGYVELLRYVEVLLYVELLRYMEVLLYVEFLRYEEVLLYVEFLRYEEVLLYVELLRYVEVLMYMELLKYVEVLIYMELLRYFELLIDLELLRYMELLRSLEFLEASGVTQDARTLVFTLLSSNPAGFIPPLLSRECQMKESEEPVTSATSHVIRKGSAESQLPQV
uniref:coiled-coil domain-containing protein 7-like n=1 Tax=Jaculus jaculus TaxID=51337 RepID=UPI001E1B2212|nr:coiled-coil domain-containing protein 7-like [Jaculus jaculus]